MATVEFKKITKKYGSLTVIPLLDLEIRSGEFMVLVGPSGCGKSTLLRTIAGLEEVSSGTVSIDGRVVNGLDPRSRGVAMVFQNYALYPHMSVKENLAFALKLLRLPKAEIESRVQEAAKVLGLQDLLAKKPGHLSGGQKQRVAMGRAMVRHPAVFLFDEPLSNLDAQLRVKMRSEISLLHRRVKSTVVYVTHDQVEAMTLADRIAVMYQGHIEQVGTPLELYHQPRTQFVASFIGSPSMNFLPATAVPAALLPAGAHTVGFRPEATELSTTPREGMVSFGKAKVQLVEPLGASAHVHLQLGDTMLVTEAKADSTPALDSEIGLWVAARHLFFFRSDGLRVEGGKTA